MKKNIIFFIILVIILLLFSTSFAQDIVDISDIPEEEINIKKQKDHDIQNILYSEFKHIEYFHFIYVHTLGSAEEIGLKRDYLTKYAKLRFKNNFAYIDYIEDDNSKNYHTFPEEEQKKIGRLFIKVWTVGDSYPIAYHVSCVAGSCLVPSYWVYSYLGYESKESIYDSIKKIINESIEELATVFFTVRGEI